LVGIQRVGLPLESAGGPVWAVDLQHGQSFIPEGSGELGAVGACSFDSDGDDCAVGGDEVDDFPVSGAHGQEFLVREGFAVFVDHGYVVCVGVGVDTRDDS
jgi:hypothetical protein